MRTSLAVRNLVGPQQRVVDRPHHSGNAVGRIQALVGIHLSAEVGVGGDLPTAQIDGLQAGLRHLHGLVAGERTQCGDVGLRAQQLPELLSSHAGQGVFDVDRAPEPVDIGGCVGAGDAFPAG